MDFFFILLFTLVCQFADELDAHQSHVLLVDLAVEVVEGCVEVVSVAGTEVVVDFVNDILVHLDVFEIVVDVELGAAIDDGLHLVEEFVEVESVAASDVFKAHLTVRKDARCRSLRNAA